MTNSQLGKLRDMETAMQKMGEVIELLKPLEKESDAHTPYGGSAIESALLEVHEARDNVLFEQRRFKKRYEEEENEGTQK